MPHAAFYVVQLYWIFVDTYRIIVSMPHAAFYVVQLECDEPEFVNEGFNAARSILCGATSIDTPITSPTKVSMPHAAFYVVQRLG